jgi:hypothetical protein
MPATGRPSQVHPVYIQLCSVHLQCFSATRTQTSATRECREVSDNSLVAIRETRHTRETTRATVYLLYLYYITLPTSIIVSSIGMCSIPSATRLSEK